MKTEPQKEHQWLHQLVGEWTCEGQADMGPDRPPETFEAVEAVRSLGGLWVLAEGKGEMPGGGASTTLMTLGYDAQKKRYVGTWVGSMMSHLWVYEGELDETGKILTLETEGPSFDGDGKTAKYRDVIEFKSADHRVLSSYRPDERGEWVRFMKADYRRK